MKIDKNNPVNVIKHEIWQCKKCGSTEIRFRYKYCPLCGEEIEWYSKNE